MTHGTPYIQFFALTSSDGTKMSHRFRQLANEMLKDI